jgi:glucose/arabinose dehydrogenase
MGVAVDGDGVVYIAEAGAGRVVKLAAGKVETLLDGLRRPEGIAIRDGKLFVVDTGAKTVTECDLASRASRVIASHLPVGAPVGVTAKFLGPIGDMAGPMVPFADIIAAPDGSLYLSGDAEGSVLAIKPTR